MKTKNALGGLLGLLGSFSALPFLTESLHHNQPTAKRNPVRIPQAKTNRTTTKNTTRMGEEARRQDRFVLGVGAAGPRPRLHLGTCSTKSNPTKPKTISNNPHATAPNSQRFDPDFELAVPSGRIVDVGVDAACSCAA
jgi:hypothetical protein